MPIVRSTERSRIISQIGNRVTALNENVKTRFVQS